MSFDASVYVRNAKCQFHERVLFENLTLSLPPHKITCLMGSSGVGKTSLLRMIAGLMPEKNTRYSMTLESDLSINMQLAYLSQQPSLLPWYNALENTLISARLRGESKDILRTTAMTLFQKFGLQTHEKKYPAQLSGGMQQRVALIRTLLEKKAIILMDEPFSALDAMTRFQLQNECAYWLKENTVLFTTHDPLEALRLADQIYLLRGQPAKLSLIAELKTPKPRDPNAPEVLAEQKKLYPILMHHEGHG